MTSWKRSRTPEELKEERSFRLSGRALSCCSNSLKGNLRENLLAFFSRLAILPPWPTSRVGRPVGSFPSGFGENASRKRKFRGSERLFVGIGLRLAARSLPRCARLGSGGDPMAS